METPVFVPERSQAVSEGGKVGHLLEQLQLLHWHGTSLAHKL